MSTENIAVLLFYHSRYTKVYVYFNSEHSRQLVHSIKTSPANIHIYVCL